MKTNKVTKFGQCKDHLLKHGKIDTWQSHELYGATRLSDTIYRLRRPPFSWNIESVDTQKVDRNGNLSIFSTYTLINTPETSALQHSMDEHLKDKPTGDKVEKTNVFRKQKASTDFAKDLLQQSQLFP